VWIVDSVYSIIWHSEKISKIKIEYSKNDGNNWENIIENTSADSGKYLWKIPVVFSQECRVRVSSMSDSSINDASDDKFTIQTAKSLVLISPTGGEEWFIDSTYTIEWQHKNINKLRIEYSINGGVSWNIIADIADSSQHRFNWDTPSLESTNCLIRVVDMEDLNVNDISDQPFSLIGTAVLEALKFYPMEIGYKWIYQRYAESRDCLVTYGYKIKEVLKDTVIDNTQYLKIHESSTLSQYVVESFVRISKETGKVYRYLENEQRDFLIRDLLAEVGDRIPNCAPYSPGFTATTNFLREYADSVIK